MDLDLRLDLPPVKPLRLLLALNLDLPLVNLHTALLHLHPDLLPLLGQKQLKDLPLAPWL